VWDTHNNAPDLILNTGAKKYLQWFSASKIKEFGEAKNMYYKEIKARFPNLANLIAMKKQVDDTTRCVLEFKVGAWSLKIDDQYIFLYKPFDETPSEIAGELKAYSSYWAERYPPYRFDRKNWC
jgi:hypothetical protein